MPHREVDEACRLLGEAIMLLARADYAVARERIHGVRQELEPWDDEQAVRELDELLYASRWTAASLPAGRTRF